MIARTNVQPDTVYTEPRVISFPGQRKQMQPIVQFSHEAGDICRMDCVDFLGTMGDAAADTVFADPPYNVGKAEWDNIGDQDAYIEWSMSWIREAYRVLKDTGTLYICGYTEVLADLKRPAMQLFQKCKWLIWHYDNKANLGKDWGRSHESILCLRKTGQYTINIDDIRIPYNAHTMKYPDRAQSGKTSQFLNDKNSKKTWSPDPRGAKPKDVIDVPTTCNGMGEKTAHPTQKPEELVRKLILASTNEGELVVDPFSGSGTTAVVAAQLKRRFLVNDQNSEYNEWARERLLSLQDRSIAEWIALDKKTAERRHSIR